MMPIGSDPRTPGAAFAEQAPIVPAHRCYGAVDARTQETYCPTCGLVVAAPPLVNDYIGQTDARYSRETVTSSLTMWGSLGGLVKPFAGDLRRTNNTDLERVMRVTIHGRLGRTPTERFERRWQAFLRSAQPYDLNRVMLEEARAAIRQIRATKTIIGGKITNQAVDAALIYLLLRSHHRPLPLRTFLDQVSRTGVRRATFNTTITMVKQLTGVGVKVPSTLDYLRLAEEEVPPMFLARARHLLGRIMDDVQFTKITPNALAAGALEAVAQHDADQEIPRPTTQKRLAEVFGIDAQWIRNVADAIGNFGALA